MWSWINAGNADNAEQDEAWDELEQYLRGESDAPPSGVRPGSGARPGQATHTRTSVPSDIRQAFHDLELKPGASPIEIRSAYRRLLLQYHPDRFHSDAERAQTAAEITQRISLAYKRLNSYYQ